MARQRGQATKLLRHNPSRIVTAALAGAHMSGMQVRIVANLDLAGRKRLKQPGANEGRTILVHLLSTVFSERTTQSACSTPNTRVRPVSPKNLKYTQVDSLKV